MFKHAILHGCYDFNDETILIEMTVDEIPKKIKFEDFIVPDTKLKKSNWQCAYMEQFLTLDGTKKLYETYNEPTEQVKPTRIAVFSIQDR